MSIWRTLRALFGAAKPRQTPTPEPSLAWRAIAVVVSSSSGGPVVGASVAFGAYEAMTNADGYAAVDLVVPARYTVTVTATGHETYMGDYDIGLGSADLPIRLTAIARGRPLVLRGRFVFHTRNPFTDARWQLPAARHGKFFMAELDNLWRLEPDEADRILTAYVAAGYTSLPTGPIVEQGYHGHYPDTNWLGDPDGFADFLDWVLAHGVEPRLFLLPDIEPWFKGTGIGWDWAAVERDLTPFYQQPRIQSAVRHTRTAWEQWAPIAEMAKAFQWQASLFPQASNLYHNAPNHLGPGNSDEDEGDCWRSALANGCQGLAIQTVPPTEYGGGTNADGRTAAGQHRYDIWDMLRRFGRTNRMGPEGQRPDQVWGDLRCRDGSRPIVDYEEGCAFADYWHGIDATAEYATLAQDEGVRFLLDGVP